MDNSNSPILNANALLEIRRKLRKDQTTPEAVLWGGLRNKKLNGYKFYRQYSIGPCVVDFCCPKCKLVIEIDGSYHDEIQQQILDKERSQYLGDRGYVVLRL